MPTLVPDPLVSDLARDLVRQVTPRELPLFAATSRAFFERPDGVVRRDAGDRTLGFGTEFAALLTPVILLVARAALQLAGEILKETLRKEGAAATSETLRRLLRAGAPDAAPDVALNRDQVALVREHALATARELVPEEQAARIADALVASLATR